MDYTQMLPEYGDILLPEDLQKILHAGRNTIYKYLAEGRIRSLMVGGKYKIPKMYLLEFIYPDYPTKAFRKIIKKIQELPQGITFHGLRSSCVSILVRQNMDVKSIQKWVGHTDIDTTLRIYAKVRDKEAKREISDAMNGIIPLKDYNKIT